MSRTTLALFAKVNLHAAGGSTAEAAAFIKARPALGQRDQGSARPGALRLVVPGECVASEARDPYAVSSR